MHHLGADVGRRVGVAFGAGKAFTALLGRTDETDAGGEVADRQAGPQAFVLEIAQEASLLERAHDVKVDHVQLDFFGEGNQTVVGVVILGTGHVRELEHSLLPNQW